MSSTRQRVLVLDGESRTALAVVRSLSSLNLEIGVASNSSTPIATFSNGCDIFFPSPSQHKNPERYHDWLLDLVKQWRPDCLLPLTDHSLAIVAEHFDDYTSLTQLPFPDPETLNRVHDKLELLRLAVSLGVRVPSTIDASSLGDDEIKLLKSASTGFIVKARRSHVEVPENLSEKTVLYFNSGEELLQRFEGKGPLKNLIIQEQISGQGVAVSALYIHGECKATFCHQRLLEKPPSGGVSVLSESIAPADAPVADALKILSTLKWHGVAMVEFKRTSSGKFVLIEINPRFWGTTQLAVDCGVDLPRMLVEDSLGIASNPDRAATPESYAVGRRSRWWLGTLDHLIIRCKERPKSFAQVFSRNSLMIFKAPGRTRSAIFRFADPVPGLIEFWNYAVDLLKGFARK